MIRRRRFHRPAPLKDKKIRLEPSTETKPDCAWPKWRYLPPLHQRERRTERKSVAFLVEKVGDDQRKIMPPNVELRTQAAVEPISLRLSQDWSDSKVRLSDVTR
jgi:hypothetical protein